MRTHDINPEVKAKISAHIARGLTQAEVSLLIRAVEVLTGVEVDPSEKVTPIGDAWLEEDGSITLRMRRTSDGQHVDGILRYKTTDEHYKDVLEHLGGLKPGEVKLVPPFP